jgi:superfamily I DNA and/or RNA helicase
MDNETIIKYLNYLKDVSRKISKNTDFGKILLTKIKKSNKDILPIQLKENLYVENYLITLNNPIFKNIQSYDIYLRNNLDKKLFIGFGLICGFKGELGGPLLVAECSLEKTNENSNYNLYINLSTLFLNYELISKVIERKNQIEDEEDIGNIQIYKEAEIINRIEEYILNIEEIEEVNLPTKKILEILKENLPEFKNIEILDPLQYDYEKEVKIYNNKKEESIFEREGLIFVDAKHLFIGTIPNDISTYQSLSNLIKEVEKEGSFKNETLRKLLEGVFSSDVIKINYNEDIEIEIDNVLDNYLPLPISSAQLKAIKNAFGYEISYIQGPPGTGKSHVISAIALASIFLNKKVLIVSQKAEAIRVIKEKVSPFLTFDTSIPPIIYFDKNIKGELRESIKYMLNTYSNSILLKEEIKKAERDVKKIRGELETLNKEINSYKKELEENLEIEKRFTEINEKFQKLKKEFESKHYSLSKNIKPIDLKILEKFNKLLEYIDVIERLKHETIATRHYKFNAVRNILIYFKPIIDKNYLIKAYEKRFISPFLKDIIDVSYTILELNQLRKQIRDNNEWLRKTIEHREKRKKELQRELIKVENKLRILKSLLSIEHKEELERFSNLLRWVKPSKIKTSQNQIKWENLLEIFPICISEIRNLNEILPMKENMFDMVIVDEASQVNLAEIIPVFYRGKSICIVGDHKQLSLNSTGLQFLNRTLDRFTWEKYKPGNLNYVDAENKSLIVTKASILDFIRSEQNNFNIVEVMLDEHFRSLPALARFTNEKFYEGKLKIMTETPDKALINCFYPVKVSGTRKGKVVEEEAFEVINIINSIIKDRRYKDVSLPEIIPDDFSIGIVSITRDQVDFIRELLDEKFDTDTLNKFKIIVGTPEQLQGQERDVMIFSLAVDENSIKSVGHYQEARRFNVATSRAKYFTFFVYTAIPHNFNLYRSYFLNFGYEPDLIDVKDVGIENPLNWKFNENAYESDFEKMVYFYLRKYIEQRKDKAEIKIFNQVKACGQKRLDFVLYNPKNKKSVAVEVDGIHHFQEDGKTYSKAHLERIEILTRAGWNIINTPYYKWYNNGWLDEDSEILKEEINRIYQELDRILFSE